MESIKAIGQAVAPSGVGTARNADTGAAGGFGDALRQALENLNAAQQSANALGRRFQAGDTAVSLEETMIAMQTASISFQATVQARNRLVSAYHDIMGMQV
ncbi:MAG: flagellar hook-basal body complex protein FliE [Burkholderiales bacterium]|nr:flagellar hook-basal body complex protein FliE [Burkholderiales bacterium]